MVKPWRELCHHIAGADSALVRLLMMITFQATCPSEIMTSQAQTASETNNRALCCHHYISQIHQTFGQVAYNAHLLLPVVEVCASTETIPWAPASLCIHGLER